MVADVCTAHAITKDPTTFIADGDANAGKTHPFVALGPGPDGACDAMVRGSPGGTARLVDACPMRKDACLRTDCT